MLNKNFFYHLTSFSNKIESNALKKSSELFSFVFMLKIIAFLIF